MKMLLAVFLAILLLLSALAAGGLAGLSLLLFDTDQNGPEPLPADCLDNPWLGWLYIRLDSQDPVPPEPSTCWKAIAVGAGRILGGA